jgi:acyl-CoA synthetase (AMP-forming)/AMP-acid ligase II
VRIVDERGRPVPRGAEGRILVRGAVVSPGYLGEEERLPGAWLSTGDIGLLDRDGRLTVRSRVDEVIVTGGENVSPGIVEAVIAALPGVVDIRIRAEADPEWGEAVVADIVLGEGVEVGAVREAARLHLAPYQLPRWWNEVERIDRGWKGETGRR